MSDTGQPQTLGKRARSISRPPTPQQQDIPTIMLSVNDFGDDANNTNMAIRVKIRAEGEAPTDEANSADIDMDEDAFPTLESRTMAPDSDDAPSANTSNLAVAQASIQAISRPNNLPHKPSPSTMFSLRFSILSMYS